MLTQTHSQVTNANNQYLVPIARNISFRQCRKSDNNSAKSASSSTFSFSSISSASNSPIATSQAQFVTAGFNSTSIFVDEQDGEEEEFGVRRQKRESPLDVLKRKAKDVVEKRATANNKYYGQSFNETLATNNERKLVVLMSWLEAKEKHIEKYRQFYLDRGFDVLNVKTSALDLLLPTIGAKKISKDFARFMLEKQYSDVVLHGFSVGGYMFGQVLLDIDNQNQEMKEKMIKSIRGIVFDSLVPFEGISVGVANSITSNKFGAKLLEQAIKLYLYVGHRIATKYYLQASDKVWSGPVKCPTLFLLSKDDIVTDYRIIERLAQVWSKLGIETYKMLVDSAPHVQLFNKHHSAYVNKIEKFLERIKMN